MGYLVEWHIPRKKFDFDILDTLPDGLRAHVFEIDECEFNLIHADFRSSKVFPVKFGEKYQKLDELYESLAKQEVYPSSIYAGLEVAINTQVVHLNLWLSNALQDEVISIHTNDDQADLSVRSIAGSLSRLRFRAEDIEVLYENGEVHIFPLITEMNEPVVNLEELDNPAFTMHAREKEQTSDLHEIAAEEIDSLLGIKPQMIGLATWDFDEECLRRVFTGKDKDKEVLQDERQGAVPGGSKQVTLKTRVTLVMLALFAVTAFNGYKEYEKSGHLDPSWYIGVGVSIALVLIVFVVLAKRK